MNSSKFAREKAPIPINCVATSIKKYAIRPKKNNSHLRCLLTEWETAKLIISARTITSDMCGLVKNIKKIPISTTLYFDLCRPNTKTVTDKYAIASFPGAPLHKW